MTNQFPKRLIEVDLPIKKISAHARREKSIRHGHISTMHIWWARRPLAACRAVLCAALWPDPADPACPKKFREDASRLINEFAAKATSGKALSQGCSHDTWKKWQAVAKTDGGLDARKEAHWNVLRFALLDFIADFADWDNSTVKEYLETARALTQSAHEALGGSPGTQPLVADPFAGGGSIPLEALRVGADVFASDVNPLPVLLNKVVLELVPKYGQRLADEVRKWGAWVKDEAEKELSDLYPRDPDGAMPIAYLWARTIRCEGPGCGAEVPLIRSLIVSKKANRRVALRMEVDASRKEVILSPVQDSKVDGGTVRLGSVTCPVCGYTTAVERVRIQLRARQGGSFDSRLLCKVVTVAGQPGRGYRTGSEIDRFVIDKTRRQIVTTLQDNSGGLSTIPNEATPPDGTGGLGGGYRTRKYGIVNFGQFFNPRQLIALTTLSRLAAEVAVRAATEGASPELAAAAATCVALAVSRQVDYTSSLCSWHVPGEKINHTFGRQALSMVWDYTEVNPFSGSSGDFGGALAWVTGVIEHNARLGLRPGTVERASATHHPLPDDCASAFVTDPPYYDAVPYGELSDFFYVWLRRMLRGIYPNLFSTELVDVSEECIVNLAGSPDRHACKTRQFFEATMQSALSEARRITRPSGIGVVVFAHKSTSGWESQLQAIIDSGWTITASWPIDTEMASRLRAQDSAVLASSIHLVCRPRQTSDLSIGGVGDWRDVLQELPRRIHEWMPRLQSESVVGADAIFACLGPALEIFSRYSRVEKPDGDQVTLKEYLEYVWAAVSKEAISMIFESADTTGFEEDARLTAVWLWTLNPGPSNGDTAESDESGEDPDEKQAKPVKPSGFTLEYDAARKIAQGLGAHLELLVNLVEVKGETARLLPVAERTKALFGKEGTESPSVKRKKSAQLSLPGLLEELESEGGGWTLQNTAKPGNTTLDRLHQAMILFAAGRGEGLRRFLVDDGAGKDQRFWSLAQSLCALYPTGTDERRWSEGVLARKKGLGL